MLRRESFIKLLGAVAGTLVVPRVVRSEVYLDVDQAKNLIFPGASLQPVDITLTPEQKKAIESASGERVRQTKLNVWKASGGGWFIVDEVLGKHEFITYAVGLTASGAVKGIEVMVYRETYGHEIKLPKWRAQFYGKNAADAVKIDKDIKNIAGATLSCVHVADGVRRLLQTYALVLKTA